ncbi:UNVERIFIED_CONTAM: Agamous-like MADS-box protein [Sesamum calycinum]|uniref:Agamous-like MADS-box protein n=1 Tax=Sesamum calycinum TaxID=2727403 RepID=A0AAW2J9V1_9LAMI
MTRKKVKLAFITNDSARKATFKKRKKGLMKKVSELSTLCGIDACAIVYGPYDSHPEVWPDGRGAHRVLAQFKRMPEMEQSKKMVNQESFIRHRITKAADQLKSSTRTTGKRRSLISWAEEGGGGKGWGGEKPATVADGSMQRAAVQQQWFTDQWMGNINPSDDQQGVGGSFGHGSGGWDEINMQFNDGSNHAAAMWANGFFP